MFWPEDCERVRSKCRGNDRQQQDAGRLYMVTGRNVEMMAGNLSYKAQIITDRDLDNSLDNE